MTQKKILLLSVSAGAGHTRAAEALRSCSSAATFEVTTIHLDVMHFVTPGLRKLYTDFYIFLVKRAPALWSYLYQIANDAKPGNRMHQLRRWAERLNSKPLLREIAQFKPDIIVCTHFLPAEILSQLIAAGGLNCPVWVQVTDFDLHRMWVHEHMAGYFAPNEEVAFRMRGQGIAAKAIHVTGIPIMAAFSQQLDRNVCAREFGIDPRVMTLLLMGGGAGLGSLNAVAEHLLGLQENFQLIVLAGKNSAALTALQELATRYPGRLVPQGYTDQVERLMACADLVVTKPGGLTTSECLAMGLPMIVNAPIPGQEESNANFLLEQGVALKAFDLATLEYRIRYLLAHPAKLEDMRVKAKALGRPHAACQVLDTVLGRTER
ncbi:MAG: galactosyldiacylglycerol synthase [Prolixibacteraceae bacterium]|nr:galactosyldiacylglycerol synthase [Burkholderiales bacterium]